MHNYNELIYKGTTYTLSSLEKFREDVRKTLENYAPTSSIKTLQMIQLQKVFLSIGMFSYLDGELQGRFGWKNGFKGLKEFLIKSNKETLLDLFVIFESAINVLKHGKGRSYDYLVSMAGTLPFKIRNPEDNFFNEGDVSEVDSLIDVNDQFVLDCAELIQNVFDTLRDLGKWL